ncbi:MAG: cation:proton antiporter [Synechococcus sp.]
MIQSYLDCAVLTGFVCLYALVSARLQRTPFSAAMVFLLAGWLLSPACLGVLHLAVDSEGLRGISEFSLALILFTDAAQAELPVLRRSARLPLRLLGLGLPLTIVVGAVVAHRLFPSWPFVEAALLGVALAPTDAALGQPVVTNPNVPASIREDLSAESGLNDGICVPALLCLLTLAERPTMPEAGDGLGLLGQFFLQQIGVGVLVGVALASLGCWTCDHCARRGWIAPDWRPVLAVSLAVAVFTLAQSLGGSGFIGCFCAGLVMGGLTRQGKEIELIAAEGAGDVFSLVTWMAFGAAVLGRALAALTRASLAYAVLSLTLIRMIPVALATAGLGLPPATTLFVGWFGPRGLASIVFAVMVLDADVPHGQEIADAITLTVALSVVAHGLTAVPLAKRFGRAVAQQRGSAPALSSSSTPPP